MSLGVDLVPLKTCALDCVFCQLGRTRTPILERREYVPARDIIKELADWYGNGGKADHVTISGSGEPTLNTGFGDVIRFAVSQKRIPVLLLTSGVSLFIPEVRSDAAAADIVKASLSSWDEASFRLVNRHASGVGFSGYINGMKAFRKDYKGRFILEVFLVHGMNDREEDVRKIAAIASGLLPHAVHLNTVARPAADTGIMPVHEERMRILAGLFNPPAEAVAGGETDSPAIGSPAGTGAGAILALVMRHPATVAQIAITIGAGEESVRDMLASLETAGSVIRLDRDGETYFAASVRER